MRLKVALMTRPEYEPEQYEGRYNLLRVEKNSIIKQLVKKKGMISRVHKVLCPKNDPYSYNAFLRVLERHNIDAKEYKGSSKK